MKLFFTLILVSGLQACAVLAVADAAGAAVVSGAKTVVNVIDSVTPDIINKKK